MKIAAIQMVSTPRVAENIETALRLLQTAAQGGAQLAVLPEYFCAMGFKDHDKLQYAEYEADLQHGPIQSALSKAAKDLGIWIVGGTIPLRSEDSSELVRSSSLVYDPKGELVIRYDKIHLFRYDNGSEHYDESTVHEAGTTTKTFTMPTTDGVTLKIGLSVSYDLRFPELYRQLSAPGSMPCDLMLIPSAFTYHTGQAHWEILLRARAIENQCYILAAAQGGIHPTGRRTWGHSMIVDPWGQILSMQAEGAGVIFADMDRQYIHTIRTQLPALKHRMLVD